MIDPGRRRAIRYHHHQGKHMYSHPFANAGFSKVEVGGNEGRMHACTIHGAGERQRG
jgi:hypothetical protein